jgi:hypothetical protein
VLSGRAAVAVEGEPPLVERLGAAMQDALAPRRRLYVVQLHRLGRRGEVLVSVDGSAGHVPMILRPDQLDPALAAAMVGRLVERLSL